MTPEKMRALQREIDELKAENGALSDSCKAVTANLEDALNNLATCERALKHRAKDLKAARAKIKTLKG